MKNKNPILLILLCAILCVGWMCFPVKASDQKISVLTQRGNISYSVEIADTPDLQKKGLMYRSNLPTNQGMVFVFEKKAPVSMWMKNTYIPLDMLFVDEKGIIRHIHEHAKPLDETIIYCPDAVKYVIEINADQVRQNQIRILDQVIFHF